MSDDDIVSKLRTPYHQSDDEVQAAADEIVALRAEVERLEGLLAVAHFDNERLRTSLRDLANFVVKHGLFPGTGKARDAKIAHVREVLGDEVENLRDDKGQLRINYDEAVEAFKREHARAQHLLGLCRRALPFIEQVGPVEPKLLSDLQEVLNNA